MRSSAIFAITLVSVSLAACASSSGPRTSSQSRDKLTGAELAQTNATSAYDALTRLRPNWLRPPGMTMTGLQNSGSPQVLVYVDGSNMGGIAALRTIPSASVTSIEFLDPVKAQSVVRDTGTGVASYVIMVRTH
jgi:hypothetical protein